MRTFSEFFQWREELWLTQGPQDGHGTRRWGKNAHPDEYNHKYGQPQGGAPMGAPMGATPQQRMKKMKRK